MRKMKRLSRVQHDNFTKILNQRQNRQSEGLKETKQLNNDCALNDVIVTQERQRHSSYLKNAITKITLLKKRHTSYHDLKNQDFFYGIFGLLICVSSISGVSAGYTNLYSCVKSPCQHGVCVDHLNSSYSCFCEDGFTGFECQTNWDECWSQPCRHGATCLDLIAAFMCHCPPGYSGRLCDSEINECLSNPCQNNGTCEDFIDRYVCTCPAGYTGANCEIDVSVCNSSNGVMSKCQNNGECIDGPGLQFYCNCTSGWRGELCEEDYNECLGSPCYNGGICVNQPGEFGCVCQNGYTGRLCEEEIIQCKTNPCKNGAYCVMENETATCYCVPDFHGQLCQDRYDDCLPYAPRCRNGGSCLDGVDSFYCSCPTNVTGVLCHCKLTPEGKKCEPLPKWFEDKPFHPRLPTDEDVPDIDTTTVSEREKNMSDYDTVIGTSFYILETLIPKMASPSLDVLETVSYREYDLSSIIFSDSIAIVSAKLDSSSLYTNFSVFPSIESTFLIEATPVLPMEDATTTFTPFIEETPALKPSISLAFDSLLTVVAIETKWSVFYSATPDLMMTPITPSYDLEIVSTPFVEATPVATAVSDAQTISFAIPSSTEKVPPEILDANFTTISAEVYTTNNVSDSTQNLTMVTSDATTELLVTTFQYMDENTTKFPKIDEITTDFTKSDTLSTEFPITEEITSEFPITDEITTEFPRTDKISTEFSRTDEVTPEFTRTDEITPKFTTDEITPAFTRTDEVTTEFPRTDGIMTEYPRPDGIATEFSRTDKTTTLDSGELLTPTTLLESITVSPFENISLIATTSDTIDIDFNFTSVKTTIGILPIGENRTTKDIFGTETTSVPYDFNVSYFDTTYAISTPWELNYSMSTWKMVTSLPEVDSKEATSTTLEFAETLTPVAYGTTRYQEVTITELTSEPEDRKSTQKSILLPITTPVKDDNLTVMESTIPKSYPESTTFIVANATDEIEATIQLALTTVAYYDGINTTTEKHYEAHTEPGLMETIPTETTLFDASLAVPTTITLSTTTEEISQFTGETESTETSQIPYDTTSRTGTSIVDTSYLWDISTQFYETDVTTSGIPFLINDTYTSSTDKTVFSATQEFNKTFVTTTDQSVFFITGESSTEAGIEKIATNGENITDVHLVTLLPEGNVSILPEFATVTSVSSFTPAYHDTTVDEVPTHIEIPDLPPTKEVLLTKTSPHFLTEIMTYDDTTVATMFTDIGVTKLSSTEFTPNVTSPVGLTSEIGTSEGEQMTHFSDVRTTAESTEIETETFPSPATTKIDKLPTTYLFTTSTEIVEETTMTTDEKLVPVTIPVRDVTYTPITAITEFSTDVITTIDRCLIVNCSNGGQCLVLVQGNEVCHCKHNYTGAFCETYNYVTMPYFTGSSYLKLDIGELSLRKGVQLYIQFTSESPNGLLSYSEGNAESFFMLLLRNSLLQFAFSCGLHTVSFLQGNQKLSFNAQTDVLVRLWWTPYTIFMPWGKGKCHASLQLNDSAPIYSEQESASADVILGHLFLGGLSEVYHSPLVVKAGLLPRLRGCISLLEVNDAEIDPWLSAVEGEGVKECGKALCPPNACLNGGTCIPGPAQWSCACLDGFEGELCERASCLNNPCFKGICLQSAHGDFDNPFCLCPAQLNGPQCKKQLGHEIGTRLFYTGSYEGYASYSSHSIKFEHRRSFVIRLHFTTRYYNQLGLMFFLGQRVCSAKKDFIALALVRGFLLLTWDLGSGVRRIVSRDPIDTTWHTHSVRVGRSSKLAWFEVDTQGNISSFAPGFLSSLDTNKILYLGGHPSWNFTHLPRDLHKFQGFKGCIFDVRVAKSMEGPWMVPPLLASSGVGQCEMDLCKGHACLNEAACQPFGAAYRCVCNPGWKGHFCSIPSHSCKIQNQHSCSVGSSCISGRHNQLPKCLCPYGKAGELCEQDVTITDPLFNTDASYISILGGNLLRGYTDISFEFKPSTADGILLLAPPTTPQGDFLALALRNKTLTLSFKLGSYSSVVEVVSQTWVEIGKWQTVSLLRRGSEGTLRFGNDITISSSPNRLLEDSFSGPERRSQTTEFLDVQPELFLGGIPDPILLPMELLPLRNISNFNGCIRNVKIGGQKFNLDIKMKRFGVLRGQGISDCDGSRCGSEVCNNGGTCYVNATNWLSCACPENYVGTTCQTPLACVDHKCQKGGTCEPIYYKRRKIEILDTYLYKNHYYCLCPPGQIGTYCEEDGTTVDSAQFRNRSYAIITQGPFLGIQDPQKDFISLNFTSIEPHGLILWKGHINDPENDYYGLGIFRARLKFIWHLGGENIGGIYPKQFICDGKWHSVSIARVGKVVTLFLDGVYYKSTAEGEYSQLNTPNTVYVGGFPDNNYLKYATFLYFQKNYFVGCLRDVRLHAGSSPVMFSSIKEGRDLQQCRRNNR